MAATAQMRRTGNADCDETNSEVDVLLAEAPPTARKPGAVLHRCPAGVQQLEARHALTTVEVLSTWSQPTLRGSLTRFAA